MDYLILAHQHPGHLLATLIGRHPIDHNPVDLSVANRLHLKKMIMRTVAAVFWKKTVLTLVCKIF
jgi:hypothetical protein